MVIYEGNVQLSLKQNLDIESSSLETKLRNCLSGDTNSVFTEMEIFSLRCTMSDSNLPKWYFFIRTVFNYNMKKKIMYQRDKESWILILP